jgi:uncharacterized protein YjiS (DUF1127 family)
MTMLTDFRLFRPTAPAIRRRIMIFLKRWADAVVAHREREAARFALYRLNDRELRDIGIDREQITDGIAATAELRAVLQRTSHS